MISPRAARIGRIQARSRRCGQDCRSSSSVDAATAIPAKMSRVPSSDMPSATMISSRSGRIILAARPRELRDEAGLVTDRHHDGNQRQRNGRYDLSEADIAQFHFAGQAAKSDGIAHPRQTYQHESPQPAAWCSTTRNRACDRSMARGGSHAAGQLPGGVWIRELPGRRIAADYRNRPAAANGPTSQRSCGVSKPNLLRRRRISGGNRPTRPRRSGSLVQPRSYSTRGANDKHSSIIS